MKRIPHLSYRQTARLLTALTVIALCSSFLLLKKGKPVFYIIGDSTVRNGDGTGKGQLWGWGSFMAPYFDTTKISVENDAIGGRSSRTFITEGRWDKILATLKKGDYVIMQFGHNDSSPLDDTARARGTIRGIGNDSTDTYNPIRRQREMVYSYGYYMRKFVNDAKAKGATAIICSPIPRNDFANGRVKRGTSDYGLWSKQVAEQTGAYFIELNGAIADEYDRMGASAVNAYFPGDHTHTNEAGAKMNAALVVKGIRDLKGCDLKKFLYR